MAIAVPAIAPNALLSQLFPYPKNDNHSAPITNRSKWKWGWC